MSGSQLAFRHLRTGKVVRARQVGTTAGGDVALQPDIEGSADPSDWMPGVEGPDGKFHPSLQTKIVIDLPPEAAMMLNQLMRETGDDTTELFRKALALYRLAKDAIREGKHIGVAATPDCLETRFVGL
jgi:hypothetical protein